MPSLQLKGLRLEALEFTMCGLGCPNVRATYPPLQRLEISFQTLTRLRSHPWAQGLVCVDPSVVPVSLSVCEKRVFCVVRAPSKSSSGNKHQGGSPLEPACGSLPPLSLSPHRETARRAMKKSQMKSLEVANGALCLLVLYRY